MELVEPRSPGVWDMAPPLVLAPAVAAAVFGLALMSSAAATVAAGTAFVTVFLVCWPVIFWMVDNGRTGRLARLVAGLICGAAPFVAAVASGIIGLYTDSDDSQYVGWVLDHGAPIPWFGILNWQRYFILSALGLVSGVATMLVLGLFQRGERRG